MAGAGAGVAYPSALTRIGLALETTRGTLESAPSYMVPVKAPKYTPDLTMLDDETIQGSMVKVYDVVPGLQMSKYSWDSFPYLDSFGLFLFALWGGPDVVGTAPTATTLSSAATAGSFTITTATALAAGDWITLSGGVGNLYEAHEVISVATDTATLRTPLISSYASGTAVNGLTTHTTSVLNTGTGQPPSASIWDYDGEEWRTVAAAQLDTLSLKGNATGLVTYDCSWMGNPASTNAAAPSTSYTDAETPAPWSFSFYINNTLISTPTEWSLDLKRNVDAIPALTGTQEYFTYMANPLEISAKITFIEQSSSPYLTDFLGDSRFSWGFQLFDLAHGNALKYHSSSSAYTTGEIDRGQEYVSIPLTIQPLPSTLDANSGGGTSSGYMTLANNVTTAYWS